MEDRQKKNVFRARSLVSSVLGAYKQVVERLPEDDPLLEGDNANILRILQSLVNNAVQHAHQAVIIVSMECKHTVDSRCELVLIVQDTGPGMTQDAQRLVSESINGAAENNDTAHGLALCKQLLDRMHGSIEFISTPGLGTKFTVTIECIFHAESMTVHGAVLQPNTQYGQIMKIFHSSGQNGALMAAMDWSKTPLGPVHLWPQSLITTASICLKSRFPMLIWWGPQLTMLYNDGYNSILRDKHPKAMGQPGLECWAEIKQIIGPMLHGVMQGGQATWSEDQMLPLERNGFAEECYFTFSYSAIHDEKNSIAGIFTAVFETTKSIIAKRRLNLLKEIGRATATTSATDAFNLIGEAIASAQGDDVPFGLLYGTEDQRLMLKASFGLPDGHAANISELTEHCLWPYQNAIEAGESFVVHDLEARFGRITCQPWSQSVSKAVIIPIRTVQSASLFGVLIVGASPGLIFDENYRTFMELIADRITNIFSAIQDYEAQRHRADELAKLDKVKTQFFTNISHEFRTPLALMLGPLADSLADEAHPLDKAQRDRQQMINNNALRLLKLVNNILDFSRIEAGRTQLNFRPVDLRAVTQQLCSTFQSVLEQAGIEFNLKLSHVSQSVYIDEDMWEKIVLNLLSNAFKFTYRGSITVSLEEETDQVMLKVTDTGVGIAEDEQPRIFERFYRAEHSKGRSFEGSGIGLALIQELVRLHGGTISFTSRMGQGTQFTVAIPSGNNHLPRDRIKGPDSPAIALQNRQAVIKEAETWIPKPGAHIVAQPAIGSDSRPHVLLVDDNLDMLTYIHKILSPKYDVTLAKDGQEALEKVRENKPDLILSDVMMPRLDGFGLIQQLHANQATKGIPVILLSARAGDEAKIEGLGQGADDYLVKTSFSEKELLARVKIHFELGQLRRHLQLEVDKKTEELRRLNTALYEFIDMICHEIRNPLHGLIGNWDLLFERLAVLEKNSNGNENNELDLTEVHEYMDNMKECTAHQARLMDEVVMLTKLYSNKFELGRHVSEPSNLLQEVLQPLHDLLDQQRITVSDDTHLTRKLEFDQRGYLRILNALLTFSVNNTQPGSVIHVAQSISEIDSTSIFKLQTKLTCPMLTIDQNIFAGLSSLHQHSFSHRSVGGRYSNTGFSLAISNLLVMIMGGEPTEVLDGGEKGLSFTILCYPVENAIAADSGRDSSKLRVPKKRALVAEDNYINQVLCRSLLKKKGFESVIANDGKEAIEKFQPDCYDFVLMDIAMPYFNGIEVTRRIRQKEKEQHEQHPVLIIGLSAYAQPEKVNEALAAGMNDFISKPATLDKISCIIDRWR